MHSKSSRQHAVAGPVESLALAGILLRHKAVAAAGMLGLLALTDPVSQ